MSSSAEAIARLHAAMAAMSNNPSAAAAAAASMAAAAASSSSSTTNPRSSSTSEDDEKQKTRQSEEQEDDEEDITYTPYKPAKLKYGKPHPDKVCENSTLSAVAPPDITYNMVMPANIIYEGKLSNLQLEAIVYGCQRHMMDLPKPKIVTTENEAPEGAKMAAAAVKVKSEKKGLQVKHESKPQADSPALSPCPSNGVNTPMDTDAQPSAAAARKVDPPSYRAGFLLGDGAGMGKGRTLAGFVVENIARGRTKHVWVSVSSDLYEDAKRDLSDLGLETYAQENCFNLGKLPYGNLCSTSSAKGKGKGKKGKGKKGKKRKNDEMNSDPYAEGVMFSTYSTLVAKKRGSDTRLEQLIQWCGGDKPEEFDGLIMFDECHKAKAVVLDENGNPTDKSTQTAAAVVELQNRLPRARVVYCSATSVSEPKNLGFMSRLGLWGYGTEHPQGFGQFLDAIKHLGTGAMELHSMHLKSIGAICARTLSYEACEFALIEDVSDDSVRKIYNDAANLWIDLHTQLADRCEMLKKKKKIQETIKKTLEKPGGQGLLSEEELFYQGLDEDSDSDDEEDLDEDDPVIVQRNLRRKFRHRKPGQLKGLFWSAHQRFFRALCIASKVDTAISTAKQALEDGHCCVIGLQSTGESRAKGAAKTSGLADEGGSFGDAFVSAPNEDLKRTIMQMFPLPPKPAGVIAPEFLNHLKKEDIAGDDTTVDDTASLSENSLDTLESSRPSRRAMKAVSYDETNVSSEGVILNIGKAKKGGKKGGKKRKSSSADSDDESDFTVSVAGDVLIDSESDDDDDAFALKKKKPIETIAWNEIPLQYDESNMCIAERVDHKRKANYRRAAEKVKGWLDTVDSLSLPPNPLDRLLNELGGPDQVAELTGRKSRQVKQYNAMTEKYEVIYEKRKCEEGPIDQINIEEKNNFQNGSKLVAILSEAASTGISLQADKRVKNQRRRVHITIELPWSADKAIQQLGRTHRSNQTTGPLYKFLISDTAGEKRFASAVAKRLALLGALTQGDRRATGSANSLGLSAFDMDNQYGSRALQKMLREIWDCSSESVDDGEVDESLYVEALKMIDGHLKEALDAEARGEGTLEDNLAPYDDDGEGEKTFRSMMYHLLTGPCQKFAASRVTSIKEGRGVDAYFESLANGSEDKESIKAKIEVEDKSALDAGLNFNVLCNLWLYDVGISQLELRKPTYNRKKNKISKSSFGVPKFLNRLLGMNMKRQGLVFDYFMKTLDAEIQSAKTNGNYDVGIKTLKGQSIEFSTRPRSFCFRGLDSPNQSVELYSVQLDGGLSPEAIMEMYNNLVEGEGTVNADGSVDLTSDTPGQEWMATNRSRSGGRKRGDEIQTGFYADDREWLYNKTEKVFFIHNPGPDSEKCLVARPNTGKRLEYKSSLNKKFSNGAFTSNPISVQRAMEVWKTEYELADIPYSEKYQFSCPGRHRDEYVFAGNIVPVLDKMLASGGISRERDSWNREKPFSIVRVEVSNVTELNKDMPSLLSSPDGQQSDDEMLQADPVVGDEDDIGKGVARELANKTSKVRFRGNITKYHDNDKNSHLDPSGSYFVKFSDGRKLEMDADQVNHARRKFEKEVNRLVSVGMDREDASSIEEQTKGASLAKTKMRKPILHDGEEDPEEYERNFEQEYLDVVPSSIVGLMFHNSKERPEFHETVLERLSQKLILKGVETTRSLYNLEKLEKAEAQSKEDEKM